MVKSLETPEPQLIKPSVKAPVEETLLTPRFYTTDFEAIAKLDISAHETEFFWRLEQCHENNQKLTKINKSDRPKFLKFWQKLPVITAIIQSVYYWMCVLFKSTVAKYS